MPAEPDCHLDQRALRSEPADMPRLPYDAWRERWARAEAAVRLATEELAYRVELVRNALATPDCPPEVLRERLAALGPAVEGLRAAQAHDLACLRSAPLFEGPA